ncbi:MAG: hypothetical protein AAGC55_12095, partial [Myxococcota bacterium]
REALDALERLYRADEDWVELVEILARKIEQTDGREMRRQLRFAAAAVHSEHLSDAHEAIELYNASLADEPGDSEALARLDSLYEGEALWPELLDVLDRRASLESDPTKRAELAYRAALVVENELLEPETAIERYAGVLAVSPEHSGARHALERLAQREDTMDAACEVLESIYRGEGDFDKLAELYEHRLAAGSADMGDPEQRRALFATLAEIYELSHGDPEGAFAVYARALAEQPDDGAAQGQLERLAQQRGAWTELVELYEERLRDIVDPQLEQAYATKLASLYEEALGDLDGAARKYRQALEVAADEREPLRALDRIYSRAGKFDELAEILSMEAEAAADDIEACDYLFRLGDLRETALRDMSGAVSAYSEVLERMPEHTAARGSLERLLLSAESERPEIISILEPLYESEGDWGRLADLLTAKLSITGDHLDRSQIYSRVAELAENYLADPVRALDATGGWLAEDPHSEQAVDQLHRLGSMVERWGEVAARLEGIIHSADTEDVKRALLGKLGAIQLDRLGDDHAAEISFRGLLDIDGESTEALGALVRIYRQRADLANLADALWRLGELTYDMDAKRTYFVEVAELREQVDLDGAVTAWREVLELDEGDREAIDRLAVIHDHREQWPELIAVLEQAARYAQDAAEERALRTRIALIYTDTLDQPDEAVAAWQSVVDVAPDADDALLALQQVHAKRGDWPAVGDVLTRRLDLLSTAGAPPHELIAVYHQLAQLCESKLDAVDDAVAYLYQVLELDSGHTATYTELERLLGAAERWHDQVELLERLAELHGVAGEGRAEIAVLARAADVWEGKLDNPDAAAEILEKILLADPGYVPALTRLAKIYEGAHDWERCGEVLHKALALGPTGRDAAE